MVYWHDWWNQLSDFQRQLILALSMVDDFWSSLTDGQKAVTGTFSCTHMILRIVYFPVFFRIQCHSMFVFIMSFS